MVLISLDKTTFLEDKIIDGFSSLIWTERAQAESDFVINTHDIKRGLADFPIGTLLATSNSQVPMIVEQHRFSTNETGNTELRIEGRGVSTLLDSRPALNSLEPLEDYSWDVEDTPISYLLMTLVNDNHQPFGDDFKLPFSPLIRVKDITKAPMNLRFSYKIPRKSRYEVLMDICKTHGLTFTEYRPGDKFTTNFADGSKIAMVFLIPKDRSDSVIFSGKRGDLLSEEYYHNISNFKNTAAVISSNTATVLSLIDENQQIRYKGLDARIGLKDEPSLAPPESSGIRDKIEYERAVGKGLAENMLVENSIEEAYTFQVSPTVSYRYDIDYELGDYVRVEPTYGPPKKYSVSEYIRSLDENGYREYPTLSEIPEQIGVVE